jgi:hypothetical protein
VGNQEWGMGREYQSFFFCGVFTVVLDACGVEGLVNHSVTVGRRDCGFVSGSRLMISLRVWRLSWGQMWKTRAQIGLVEWSSGDGVVGVVVAWYLVHVERCVVRSDSRRNMCVQLVQHECQPMENRSVGGSDRRSSE